MSSNKRPPSTNLETPAKRSKVNETEIGLRCVTCENASRVGNNMVCTLCRKPLVTGAMLNHMIEAFWRSKYPFSPSDAGFLLGVALQEQFPEAMQEAKTRTNLLENQYVKNAPCNSVVHAVTSTLGPLFVTTAEFLALCGALSRAVPEYKATGLPADLWYQLLMFCNIEVAPLSVYEDAVSFPMPPNLVQGVPPHAATYSSCLYLHAQNYFYTAVANKTRLQTSKIIAHDMRRLCPTAWRVVTLADEAIRGLRECLQGHLLVPIVDVILAYVA